MLRECPLVIAAVVKILRKRRLCPVVRVNEKSLHSQAFFRDFSSHTLFQSTVGNFTETDCALLRVSGRILAVVS